LKQLLCRPFKDVSTLQKRYKASDSFGTLCNIRQIESLLNKVYDIDKLHRKMSLKILHPHEFYALHTSYTNIIKIREVLLESGCEYLEGIAFSDETHEQMCEFMEIYQQRFDMDEMQKYSLNENRADGTFFKPGIPAIDNVYAEIVKLQSEIESIRSSLIENTNLDRDWFKLAYNDQEGYYIACTHVRLQTLKSKLPQTIWDKMDIKKTSSLCRVRTTDMTNLSIKLQNLYCVFDKNVKQTYLGDLEEWHQKYSSVFKDIRDFVECIDIIKSNVKCKQLYKYCTPEVVDNASGSFIDATGVRHPIIERLDTGTAYVPNDVKLDQENMGMVLYALNSCGKSSLLRSIGVCVVLAQCGLYVPCTTFKFSPFHSIITQVDLQDNLWKSQSSFISEMVGLKRILNTADARTLVLSDELTKGTEVVSATSIFASAVMQLVSKQCKFIFTTHLQGVAKLTEIQSCKEVQICHLSVDINGDEITFERKLKPGPSSELYGLEVARAVGLDQDFMETAFNIRKKLVENNASCTSITDLGRKSRYNSKKILVKCEICEYIPKKETDIPLDTHHIKFQCHADKDNYTGHYHKNSTFNLVCLCKMCHVKVHNGNIYIK